MPLDGFVAPLLAMTVGGGAERESGSEALPSLIRFVVTVCALVGLVYLGMLALVANVKVQPREMTQIVTLPKASP